MSGKPSRQRKTIRELKSFANLETTGVKIVNPGAAPGGYKKSRKKPLRSDVPSTSGKIGIAASGAFAGKNYNNAQVEGAAWRCLHHVLLTADIGELMDLRQFRGFGADAVSELKQFFELKSFAAEAPYSVELNRNETKRALAAGKNFYLAVVSGLEKGYQTEVRIYANPLKSLDWSPSKSVVFSGLKEKTAAVWQLDVDMPFL